MTMQGIVAPPLVQEIAAQARDRRVALAMLLGALLEGGSLTGPWTPNLSDPYGGSYGPYQINGIHGLSPEQADNPQYATAYMLPTYQQAVAQLPVGLWSSDPVSAAAQAVYLAERPAQMYSPASVQAAAQRVGSLLASMGEIAPSSGITLVSGPGMPGSQWLRDQLGGWLRGAGHLFGLGGGTLGGAISGILPGWPQWTKDLGGKLVMVGGTLADVRTWWRVALTLGAVLLIGLGILVMVMSTREGRAAAGGVRDDTTKLAVAAAAA